MLKGKIKELILLLMPNFSICDCQHISLSSVTASRLPADPPYVVTRWQICHVPGGMQVIIYVGHINSTIGCLYVEILNASAAK